jgi:hypothetical protein
MQNVLAVWLPKLFIADCQYKYHYPTLPGTPPCLAGKKVSIPKCEQCMYDENLFNLQADVLSRYEQSYSTRQLKNTGRVLKILHIHSR